LSACRCCLARLPHFGACPLTAVCCHDRAVAWPLTAVRCHDCCRRSSLASPKQTTRAFAPKEIRDSETVKIGEVSTESDSGWRDEDPKRIDQLVETFLAGDYGLNILRKPSILWDSSQSSGVLAMNGCYRLVDGKSTFKALQKLELLYIEEQEKPEE